MRGSVVAMFKHSHSVDVSEPIRCAQLFKPTPAEIHKRELLRYLVLAVAFVAVVILIAIALYYTQGNSIHIQHISSVATQYIMRA